MSAESAPRARITVEQLHDQLRAAVDAIETGEQWQSWLDFSRRFHRYSFHNLMLIMAQRPEASAVASYNTWQAADRQVRRGEKSIKIIAPVTKRAEVTDEIGQPKLDADGRKQSRQHVVSYRTASVFDIDQTYGPPVPEPVRPTLLDGDAPAGLWESLAGEVSERGYRLLRAGSERLGGANGLTVPRQREVLISDDIDGAQAVKSLTHELAHIVLHVQGDRDDEPCRGIREVEAESVAYLTLASYGIESDAYSFPYVADWAYPVAAVEHVELGEIVSRTGQRVIETARAIIDAIQPSDAQSSPAMAALAVRATKAAERTFELRDESRAMATPSADRSVLLGIVADSQTFLRSQLADSWVPDYLAERGLLLAVNTHEIGYAPAHWTGLTDHLRSLGYSDSHIEAAGMATRARNGRLIDRLRDRMSLPIRDQRGDLVGFTARVAPNASSDVPKYLNTPTTPIFRKGEVFYRSAESFYELQRGHRPVICEGPLDAAAVDLAARRMSSELTGLAACGTAFTDVHAQQLANVAVTNTVFLAFDGDEAGRKAAERAWERIADAAAINVRIAELPSGSDPGSLGPADPAELVRILHEARGAAYLLADNKINSADIGDDVQRRLATFRKLAGWAERLPAEQRVDFVRYLARRTGMDPVDAAEDVAERQQGFLADASPELSFRNSAALATELADGAVRTRAGDDFGPLERAPHRAEIAG